MRTSDHESCEANDGKASDWRASLIASSRKVALPIGRKLGRLDPMRLEPQPSNKRFTIRRIIESGDLWVTEFILTYDVKPSYTVSIIMEFWADKVAWETQYFADSFPAPAFRAQWVEGMPT